MQQSRTEAPTRVLITGTDGMIARNLSVRLDELPGYSGSRFGQGDDAARLSERLADADAVVHVCARPSATDGANALEQAMIEALGKERSERGRTLRVVILRPGHDGAGTAVEGKHLATWTMRTDHPATIFDLPEVFGKWCGDEEASIVAECCRSISRGQGHPNEDASKVIDLVFVDDVVNAILSALSETEKGVSQEAVTPVYPVAFGDLTEQIRAFDRCRVSNFRVERVGWGLVRALYSTYISYQPNERFSYALPGHRDPRGVFVEILKTPDSGQFSYFTINPGFARGGHYHHTMSEKILVVKGKAVIRFRHLLTGELVEIPTSGDRPEVIDTIPGWAHEVNNVGDDELLVMLWANEIYDPANPDTIPSKV